jgi:hypothetical protein
MDANKLGLLRDISYKILPVCALCKHSTFSKTYTTWGYCAKHIYKHLKHSDSERDLSISVFGSCKSFELDGFKMIPLSGFGEFVEEV